MSENSTSDLLLATDTALLHMPQAISNGLRHVQKSGMFLAARGIMGRPSLMQGLDVGSTGDGGARGGRSADTTVL